MAPRAIVVAAAAVAGYFITILFLNSIGYPDDPADGPAITGAAIYGLVALAVLWAIDRRRASSSGGR